MTSPVFEDILHELAEGLQAAGTYLDVAHQMNSRNPSKRSSIAEIIEKAAGQVTRAQASFAQLRNRLNGHEFHIDESSVEGGTRNRGAADERLGSR